MCSAVRVLPPLLPVLPSNSTQCRTYSAGYGFTPKMGMKKYGTSTCWITHHACTNKIRCESLTHYRGQAARGCQSTSTECAVDTTLLLQECRQHYGSAVPGTGSEKSVSCTSPATKVVRPCGKPAVWIPPWSLPNPVTAKYAKYRKLC